MPDPFINPESNVRAVMDAHPENVSVFLSRWMLCAGCVMALFMAPFIARAEAAANYGANYADPVPDLRASATARSGERA